MKLHRHNDEDEFKRQLRHYATKFIETAFREFLDKEMDFLIEETIAKRQRKERHPDVDHCMRRVTDAADEFLRNIGRIPLRTFRPDISTNAFERRINDYATRYPEFAAAMQDKTDLDVLVHVVEQRNRVIKAAEDREKARIDLAKEEEERRLDESPPKRKRGRSPEARNPRFHREQRQYEHEEGEFIVIQPKPTQAPEQHWD